MPLTFGQHDSDVPILAKVTREDRPVPGLTLEGEYRDIDDGSLVQELASDGETDEHGEVYFEEFDEDDLLDDTLLYDVRLEVRDGDRVYLVHRDQWGPPEYTLEDWSRYSVGTTFDEETDNPFWEFDANIQDVSTTIEVVDDHYLQGGRSLFLSTGGSDIDGTFPPEDYYLRSRSGGTSSRPEEIRYCYREQTDASGYAMFFFNSDGDEIFAFCNDNPEFGVRERGDEERDGYDDYMDPSSPEYEFWAEVSAIIDWEERTFEVTWTDLDESNGTDTREFELMDVDTYDFAEVWFIPTNSSTGEIAGGSGGVYTWLDLHTRPGYIEDMLQIEL